MDFSSLEGSSQKQPNLEAFDDISSIHSQQNIGGPSSHSEKQQEDMNQTNQAHRQIYMPAADE